MAVQSKNRELSNKVTGLNSKVRQNNLSLKMDFEKKKQENLSLQKELIQVREATDTK